MAIKPIQNKLFEASNGVSTGKTAASDIIAIGTVVDTNDPMQWGRIRIVVPAWGDSWEHLVDAMPWAMYVSPFGGQTTTGTRGPNIHQTEGGVAYGMWAIPNVGAQVVVMSLDEDHQQRLFMGCVYEAFTTHTLPHGRWMFEDHPALDGQKPKAAPFGPYSSGDKLIQPLAGNLAKAFGNTENCHEWQTRAADFAATRVDVSQLQYTTSQVPDDHSTVNATGWSCTQGYQDSRVDPKGHDAPKNYDSHTYSFTSPGFHSMSMDDRMENCRIRFRTTSGHQILLDDTNERIYIATAQGNNWIELDQAGNIDMFTTNKVNIRAAQDINLTSDKTIRMYAKEGIHMHSDDEIRMNATKDINVHTAANIRQHSVKSTFIQADEDYHTKVAKAMMVSVGADIGVTTNGNLNLTASKSTNVNSGTVILMTAPDIYQNGPTAKKADKAKPAAEQLAFYTNRVPAHEPWARTMTKKDTGHSPEVPYDDPNVGKVERGKIIPRGIYWRR